jgi:hypothetical protein
MKQLLIELKKVYKVDNFMIVLIQVSNYNNIIHLLMHKNNNLILWNAMKLHKILSNYYKILIKINAFPLNSLNRKNNV